MARKDGEEPPRKIQKIDKLVGFGNFKRCNPMSERFETKKFHHIEFWCHDATNVARRFAGALGMQMVARSDVGTGNFLYTSYVLQSNDLVFVFTAPYWTESAPAAGEKPKSFVDFDRKKALDLIASHGLFVRAIGIEVGDAEAAYRAAVENGARAAHGPVRLAADDSTSACYSEIEAYGDVVLRFVSRHGFVGPMLPGYVAEEREPLSFGFTRLDHCVGNVPELLPVINYLRAATGYHEFAEFVSEDVGTVDSGLNSMVLASNNEMILLPVNEPTFGTKRRSQIQTYLEHNVGPGVQHLALKTDDIFATMRKMRAHSAAGGLEFMPRPSDKYYRELPGRIGDVLTPQQYKEVEELGLLVDRDDQGTLLQIFTKPVLDRPTLFFEIIQRLGCEVEGAQKGGCGGFGKGNFSELFKSIEEFEKDIE